MGGKKIGDPTRKALGSKAVPTPNIRRHTGDQPATLLTQGLKTKIQSSPLIMMHHPSRALGTEGPILKRNSDSFKAESLTPFMCVRFRLA